MRNDLSTSRQNAPRVVASRARRRHRVACPRATLNQMLAAPLATKDSIFTSGAVPTQANASRDASARASAPGTSSPRASERESRLVPLAVSLAIDYRDCAAAVGGRAADAGFGVKPREKRGGPR
ncbi:MAG: hypothetical protein ACM3ZE_02695, partial [Myxococcales bacterium]